MCCRSLEPQSDVFDVLSDSIGGEVVNLADIYLTYMSRGSCIPSTVTGQKLHL